MGLHQHAAGCRETRGAGVAGVRAGGGHESAGREDTRDGHDRAGQQLALTRGVDTVTFADVAAQAELARSVIYHYFPDRHALLIAHAEDETRRFLDALTAALPAATSAPDRVALYVRMQLTDFVEHPQPAGHELAALLGPEAYARMHAHVQPLTDLLVGIIEDGVAAGEFATDRPRAAAGLVHACLGAQRHPLGQSHRDLAAAVEDVTAFVLRGLGARSS